jgi:uncharacterized membrane protein
MSPTQNADKSAAEYGREALAHWMDAARFGARALSDRKKGKAAGGVKERLQEHLPSTDGDGAELAELADAALAKLGKAGKLAAKAGVGRRLVEKLLPEGEAVDGEAVGEGDGERRTAQAEAEDEHLFDDTAPMPIQESVDVAVPVAAAFDLCSRFEELARFSERISEVEIEDESHFTIVVKIGGRHQTLAIEVIGEEPEERLDWASADGFAHAGVVSFHPLAPRLTRVELTIEPESEGFLERLLRLAGLPERAIRQELRRFKAYAELWDEANDYRSADFKDPGTEAAEEEAAEEEEPEDEEPADEEAEEEAAVDGESEEEFDEEAEEPLEEEELEPAANG